MFYFSDRTHDHTFILSFLTLLVWNINKAMIFQLNQHLIYQLHWKLNVDFFCLITAEMLISEINNISVVKYQYKNFYSSCSQ